MSDSPTPAGATHPRRFTAEDVRADWARWHRRHLIDMAANTTDPHHHWAAMVELGLIGENCRDLDPDDGPWPGR